MKTKNMKRTAWKRLLEKTYTVRDCAPWGHPGRESALKIHKVTQPLRVKAKARYRQAEQPATVYPEENGFARVVFDQPQRAMTPGQAVVLYDGDLVVGGGTIREIL